VCGPNVNVGKDRNGIEQVERHATTIGLASGSATPAEVQYASVMYRHTSRASGLRRRIGSGKQYKSNSRRVVVP
jgi:hypothetical protein